MVRSHAPGLCIAAHRVGARRHQATRVEGFGRADVREAANNEVEGAVAAGADVGEGPHWDAKSMCLWFVDLTAGTVFGYFPSSERVTAFSVGQPVGAVVPRR